MKESGNEEATENNVPESKQEVVIIIIHNRKELSIALLNRNIERKMVTERPKKNGRKSNTYVDVWAYTLSFWDGF